MFTGKFLLYLGWLAIPVISLIFAWRWARKQEKEAAILQKQIELYRELVEMIEENIKEHSVDESKCKNI